MRKSIFLLSGALSLAGARGVAAQLSSAPPVVGDVTVSGSALAEDKPDGAFGEPEWVRQRRFSTTRVFVQKDPWEIGVEEWWRTRFYDGGNVTQRLQTEFEIGLPHRMQLDIYENIIHDNAGGGWKQDEVAVELRYAFADWNVIPGNPTFYFEYAFANGGPDAIEPKILFGGEMGDGWHWGLNGICEQQLWGKKSTEWGIAGGVSRVILDNKLSVGVEGKWTAPLGEKSEMILGPSVQWRPTANTHLDVVAMAGLTNSSPNAECWMIFGLDFGEGSSKDKGYHPTSLGGS